MSELPDGWIKVPLGEVNEFSGSTVNPASRPDELFELYSVPSFPTGKPERLLGSEIGSTKQTVEAGDVLISKINPRINRVWTVGPKSSEEQIASSEWIGFRSEAVKPAFANYYFRSQEFRDLLCSEVAGVGGSLTRAQPKRVAAYPLPIAPLAEQTRIADQLDTLLARVNACNDHLDAIPGILKRIRQAVLNATQAEDFSIEDFSGGTTDVWQSTTVGEVLEGKPRNGYSPKSVSYETPVKSLTLSATTTGRFLPQHTKFIDEHISEDSHLWLECGDILIQRANTLDYVGVSAIFEGPSKTFIYPDLMMKCRPKEHVRGKFLLYALSTESTRQYFRDNATGTAGNMPKINQQTVMAAPILIPDLKTQDRIIRQADLLIGAADRIESRYNAMRAHAQRLAPQVLAKAFRGELVEQDPNDEIAGDLLARLRTQRATSGTEKAPRRARQPRTTRAQAEASTMTKSRQNEDVKGQPYLAGHLRRLGVPTTAQSLFKEAELPVADFYKQLAWEIAEGHVKDNQTTLEPGHATG